MASRSRCSNPARFRFTWRARPANSNQGVDLADHPNAQRWFDAINARPAVHKARQVLADCRKPQMDERIKETLF